METTTQLLNRGQAGGLALVQKHGRQHMQAIGRKGGRPRSLTVEDITPIASATCEQEKEKRHGKSRVELLRLWNVKRSSSCILPEGEDRLSSAERSSLEDSQHPGGGAQNTLTNKPLLMIPFVPLPQPTETSTPAPGRGGTR